MRIHWTSPIVLFVLALTGCGVTPVSGQDENPHPMEPLAPLSQPTPTSPSLQNRIEKSPNTPTILRNEIITTQVSDDLEKLINIAKLDLSKRLGFTPDEIEVLHIDKAEWPDTSLGCAKPSLTRRFVAIPGYRIILSANGWNYVYHTNKKSGIVYCPKDKGR